MIRSYGGVSPESGGTTARRAFFLVDQQGIVRGKWLPPAEDVFPSARILEAARALQRR